MDVELILAKISADLPADKRALLKTQLAAYLNDLVLHDFQALVQLLYRVDVPEKKVKAVLKENPHEDAGALLADLLIRRQLEKQATRNSFRSSSDATEEERW
ncbi:MAG TPA: hypothetical protein VFL47_01200 [Flavisolibacter sp.]|nr:hypothetical protein [Flavisolibacter sp.]